MPAAWGTGVNTETKLLLLTHAFEGLGCFRVEFKTDATKRAGARGAGGDPRHVRGGVPQAHAGTEAAQRRDSAWYSVVDDDWPAVKAALEARVAAKG